MREKRTLDGNEAAALVAYKFTEAAFIYPITPSTSMAEKVEKWSADSRRNLFGEPVEVVQMQSEAGVAGAMHGALACGALATTFTASQGLLLMLPNLYKITAERLPGVFYVASRTVASHALSIFGDHSDIYAIRQTGCTIICASSVQEVMDLAPVAHAAAISGRFPVIFFFDGFRTSHEVQKIEVWSDPDLKDFLDANELEVVRRHGLNPNNPVLTGSAQNPDMFFQTREAGNLSYMLMSQTVKAKMELVNSKISTDYAPFNYYGAVDATHVVVAMGAVCETLTRVVDFLNNNGHKVGVCKVRLYRPFSSEDFINCLPDTTTKISVLDRTKEAGSNGEPLYLDVLSVINNSIFAGITVFHGRYGLASKDTTPSQLMAVFFNQSKAEFTIGINDDVTYLSLEAYEECFVDSNLFTCCKFWGHGGDGLVSACKIVAKLIGEDSSYYPQLYSEYDSRKTGGLTISHLRYGKSDIHAPYLISKTHFVCCSHFDDLMKYDIVSDLLAGGTLLINGSFSDEKLEQRLPSDIKKFLIENRINIYIVDADLISRKAGLSNKTNIVMLTAFLYITNIVSRDVILSRLPGLFKSAYTNQKNSAANEKAIDMTIDGVKEIHLSDVLANDVPLVKTVNDYGGAPNCSHDIIRKYVTEIQEPVNAHKGDSLPVSSFLSVANGAIPRGTTAFEKTGNANYVPVWNPEKCIQCNHCSFVCPHGVIRPYALSDDDIANGPDRLKNAPLKGLEKYHFSINISAMDCTGCASCLSVCPKRGQALTMKPLTQAKENQTFFDYCASLPPKPDISNIFRVTSVKGSQFCQPLLEFSGACGGCGETPYAKLLTQLFGEKMYIANATGCSSIWGNSAPNSAYCSNYYGKGPAWSNSLFEDAAEFGFGMYKATEILSKKGYIDDRSHWIFGGDGWAYDIGYGGLEHILSKGANINVLIFDTEVYSNTGGQLSSATPKGAKAKFASSGKKSAKMDLASRFMTHGDVYVASVAMGADMNQCIKAMVEAESYPGSSVIIAYSPCIAHGIKGSMVHSQSEQALAVECGHWKLFRYDPRLEELGLDPYQLDSSAPTKDYSKFTDNESRFS